jgi:hypothetical protein
MEIFHIVDPQRIAADQTFVQYVRKSNIRYCTALSLPLSSLALSLCVCVCVVVFLCDVLCSILEQQLQAQDEIIKYLEDPYRFLSLPLHLLHDRH